MLKEFLEKEKAYFYKLNHNAQKLLITIFLDALIGPVFGTFINAFLWRQSHDIWLVALYNICMYGIVPFGFYLNGWLLRKFTPATPYTIAIFLSLLALAVLMFLTKLNLFVIIIFGILEGIGTAVYWANRNLLTLKTTTTHDRIYFSSIESASSTIAGVLVPLFIGWFITFGTPFHLYTPVQGYQFILLYVLIVTIRIGIISRTIRIPEVKAPRLLVKDVSDTWKKFRLMQLLYGVENAVNFFIPVLLVLIIVGNEAALGIVQSISAILASILIYFLGKTLNTSHRLKLIKTGIMCIVAGAACFSALYSAIGIVLFFAAQALSEQFLWVGFSSINYDLIDMDNKDVGQHYAYVCDQEIYLNGGRVLGIILFLMLLFFTSNVFALRFSPLIFACTQILLLLVTNSIKKQKG